MLRYLYDPANAITTSGILMSGLALHFALAGQLELSVAIALWAMLADHLDGVVASRARNRPADMAKMGKSLDGFSDIIYGAVFPAVCIIQLSGASRLSMLTAVLLLLAGAIRLSYFNNFGLSADGKFAGVPLSYDVPLLAVLFLARPWLEPNFVAIANLSFLLLAALHVASIRVPSPGARMYAAIVTFSIGASGALAVRSLT